MESKKLSFLILFLLSIAIATVRGQYEWSAYDIVHGDLLDFDSLFLLPMNDTIPKPTVNSRRNTNADKVLEDAIAGMVLSSDSTKCFDIYDFNQVLKESLNLTRRAYYGSRHSWEDNSEDGDKKVIEARKIQMLKDINLTFLTHTRFKIAEALKIGAVVRPDKRYRLGYLFNRLRRLNTEQRKLVTIAYRQIESKVYEDLRTTMAVYERVVRLDVDIRDTIAMVKEVYGEYHPVDQVEAVTAAPQ